MARKLSTQEKRIIALCLIYSSFSTLIGTYKITGFFSEFPYSDTLMQGTSISIGEILRSFAALFLTYVIGRAVYIFLTQTFQSDSKNNSDSHFQDHLIVSEHNTKTNTSIPFILAGIIFIFTSLMLSITGLVQGYGNYRSANLLEPYQILNTNSTAPLSIKINNLSTFNQYFNQELSPIIKAIQIAENSQRNSYAETTVRYRTQIKESPYSLEDYDERKENLLDKIIVLETDLQEEKTNRSTLLRNEQQTQSQESIQTVQENNFRNKGRLEDINTKITKIEDAILLNEVELESLEVYVKPLKDSLDDINNLDAEIKKSQKIQVLLSDFINKKNIETAIDRTLDEIEALIIQSNIRVRLDESELSKANNLDLTFIRPLALTQLELQEVDALQDSIVTFFQELGNFKSDQLSQILIIFLLASIGDLIPVLIALKYAHPSNIRELLEATKIWFHDITRIISEVGIVQNITTAIIGLAVGNGSSTLHNENKVTSPTLFDTISVTSQNTVNGFVSILRFLLTASIAIMLVFGAAKLAIAFSPIEDYQSCIIEEKLNNAVNRSLLLDVISDPLEKCSDHIIFNSHLTMKNTSTVRKDTATSRPSQSVFIPIRSDQTNNQSQTDINGLTKYLELLRLIQFY